MRQSDGDGVGRIVGWNVGGGIYYGVGCFGGVSVVAVRPVGAGVRVGGVTARRVGGVVGACSADDRG